MTTEDKLIWGIGLILSAWFIVLLTLWFCVKGKFQGYYISGSKIWAAYSYTVDEMACEYNEERWQYIVENDLHLRKTK